MDRAVLEVELSGSRLSLRFVPPTATWSGGLRPVVQEERDIELELVRDLALDVARVLNRGTRWVDVDQGSRELLRRKGAALFDALLPPAIKAGLRRLSSGAPVALTLALDAATRPLPWELLHTGYGFLGLSCAIGRADAGPSVEARPPPRRMLVIADPRGDLIGSYYEGLTLRDELGGRADQLRVDLRSSEVGVGDVLELVRDYDIVHYAGHAEPCAPGEPRGWWLRDGVLTPKVIAALAGGPSFPRLVVVNACRSARDASASIDARGLGGPDEASTESLTDAFRAAGAAYVIGTMWDVPDEPASAFAMAFYAALMAGAPVGEATRRGRMQVATRYGEDSIFWAAWVLHGDPQQPCFEGDAWADDPSVPGPQSTASEELPVVAARVRGAVLADAGPQVLSLDGHGPSRWVFGARWLAGLISLVAMVGLTWGVGRRNGDAIVARPIPSADFGPIERLAPLPLAAVAPPEAAVVRAAALTLAVVTAKGPTSVLTSGQSFRLRWTAPADGFVSLWQVESQGGIRRILPAEPGQVLASVKGGTTAELPGAGRWYYLDDRSGSEHFFIAWRAFVPVDPEGFARELEREVAAIAATPGGNQPMELRGLGGVRGHDSASVVFIDERFQELIEDRFDAVETVLVVHQ